MKVALITRSTLHTVPGGDSVQIMATARHLEKIGVSAEIILADQKPVYHNYDLLHFFNLTRPADILYHIQKSKKPFVLSPVMIDYSEYDKNYRHGIPGFIFRTLPAEAIEYLKTIARWLTGRDKLITTSYLWLGQKRCIRKILAATPLLLPNSDLEYEYLKSKFETVSPYIKIYDGVDPELFRPGDPQLKEPGLVLCAGRIEGIKNQLNLIRALNDTGYKLLIIGDAAPNQRSYFRKCRSAAAKNIFFTGRLTHDELIRYYHKASVHVLPSWFEVCGLSSLEAAAAGCRVVITDKGFAKEYFGEQALYCDPASPASIFNAVDKAYHQKTDDTLSHRIRDSFTWENAAMKTATAYQEVLKKWKN